MTYEFGRVYPLERQRGIMGHELAAPEWYILTTPPQREVGAKAWLKLMGVEDVWFPTETAFRSVPNGRRKKVAYEKRIVPGYLFVLFGSEPVWDVLFAAGRDRVSGVVSLDAKPYKLDVDVLAQMQQVPERIAIIRDEETAREKAARLALAPRVGEAAYLTSGHLAGRMVDIERIDYGIAHFLMGGLKGSASVDDLEAARAK